LDWVTLAGWAGSDVRGGEVEPDGGVERHRP